MRELARLGQALAAVACGVLFIDCAPNPPPRWAEGGAPLVIGEAHWDRADDDPIDITATGEVLEDGDPIFLVDRAGRLVDEDSEPVAILLPDGFVAGPDNVLLGRVGHSNAAPPGSAAAWLSILPNGQAVVFDSDGEREADGVWRGCDGPKLRTCTFVMHMVRMRNYRDQRGGGVTFGVGVGVGL